MRYSKWASIKTLTILSGVVLLFWTIALNAQVHQQDSTRTKVSAARTPILIAEEDRAAINNIFPPKARRWENDSIFSTSDPAAFLTNCRENAYLAASLDKTTLPDTTITLFLGPRFHWITFRPADDETRRWLQESALINKFRSGQPIRATQFAQLETQLLEQAENSGYPFAAVGLDSLVLDSAGGASTLLRIRPGPFFSYKSLKINGDIKIPELTVARYLGIKPEAPFSRTQVIILPEYGAMLHAFIVETNNGPHNIIDNYSGAAEIKKELATSFKSSKLSPFACRIPGGKYMYDGEEFELENKFMDGTAIHGLLYNKPFKKTDEFADEQKASVTTRTVLWRVPSPVASGAWIRRS